MKHQLALKTCVRAALVASVACSSMAHSATSLSLKTIDRNLATKNLRITTPITKLAVSTPKATLPQSSINVPSNVSPYEDQYNVIFSKDLDLEKQGDVSSTPLSSRSFINTKFNRDKKKPPAERPAEKIHPVLQEWINTRNPDDEETLIVVFKDNLKIPRLPNPRDDLPREHPENQRIMKTTQAMISEIKSQRAQQQGQLAKELQGRYGAELKDQFWLVNGLVVNLSLGWVKELANRDDLLYIEPESGGEKPPANEVKEGRKQVVSDPYFNLGQTAGYIGLLDTGLRFSHTQFNTPSNIDFRYDCTDGVCNNVPDVSDDCWNHGTSSAAIISGNNNLGNLYRGVTGITLDSFKVYPAGCGGLSSTASVKAFERAISILDRVIVAEMQGGGGMNSSISTAADNAFDAGAVIIAANGNNGASGSGSVNAPANAHRVLGVGNFDVGSGNQIGSQSLGPTADNRYKPDIQAPTNTRTASAASDTATRFFGGTSGATPYASGVAALMRNWLRGNSGSIDPGQVYSHLILSGQTAYPFNNTSGAGKLKMPTGGRGYWGKVVIGNGGTIEIPISVNSRGKIEGALWWPETSGQSHNDIDLSIISPSGAVMDSSVSIPSVFERARYEAGSGNLTNGTWKIRIRGYSVPTGNQTVYWSARVR